MAPRDRDETPELSRLRGRIDAVDRKIVALLNERAALAVQVGRAKASAGMRTARDAARERQVLERIVRESRGPLPEEDLVAVYRRLIAATRRLQEPNRGSAAGARRILPDRDATRR